MEQKNFTLVRKDVLDNPDLSLSAKGLYCLICYDLTKSLRRLLINKNTREETINSSKELEKYDYAHFYNLEECVDKNQKYDSYEFENLSKKINKKYEKNKSDDFEL